MNIKVDTGWRQFFGWTLLLLITPMVAMAAGIESSAGLSTYNLFTPPITDKSVNYLGELFGTVESVLHGTSVQLLGNVF